MPINGITQLEFKTGAYADLISSDVLVAGVRGLANTIAANGYQHPRLEQIDREALEDHVKDLNKELRFWKESSTPGGFLLIQFFEGFELKDFSRLEEYKLSDEDRYVIPAERVTGINVLPFGGNPVMDARIQGPQDLQIDSDSKWSVGSSDKLKSSVENSGRWIRVPVKDMTLRTITEIKST